MRAFSPLLASALIAALAMVAAGACKSDKPKPAPPPGSTCTIALADHCGGGGCPTFEARVAELRAQVGAHYEAGSCLTRAVIGTCADLKYVESSDGYHGKTDYFDRAGHQLAGEQWSDIGSCDGTAAKAVAGTLPSCIPTPTEILCPVSASRP
jgi:hypothetical protein